MFTDTLNIIQSLKKKEPCHLQTWMNPEGITLNKINQKTNTVWHHLHAGFLKDDFVRSRVEWELPEVEGEEGTERYRSKGTNFRL